MATTLPARSRTTGRRAPARPYRPPRPDRAADAIGREDSAARAAGGQPRAPQASAAMREGRIVGHASIDEHAGTGHVAGHIGRQHDGHPGNVLRLADALYGDLAEQILR